MNCPKCGVRQVRIAWAEDASRFTESFEELTRANARGYRNFANYRIAILFSSGKLDLYPISCSP